MPKSPDSYIVVPPACRGFGPQRAASTDETLGPFFVMERDMVKFEDDLGRPVFISATGVTAISASGIVGHSSVCAGMYYCVKGTPEEVHAKLFPEASPPPIADVDAALSVLNRIVDSEGGFLPHIVIMARKALGR